MHVASTFLLSQAPSVQHLTPGKWQSWGSHLRSLCPEAVLRPFHTLPCSPPSTAFRFLSDSCYIPDPDTQGAQSTPPTRLCRLCVCVHARAAIPGKEVSDHLPHLSGSPMAHALTQVSCIRLVQNASFGAR